MTRLALREGEWTPLPADTSVAAAALSRDVARANKVLTARLPAGLAPFLEYDPSAHAVRARYVGGWLRAGELDLVVVPSCLPASGAWIEGFISWFVLAAESAPNAVTYLQGRLDLDSSTSPLIDLLAVRYARTLQRAVQEQPLTAYSRVTSRTSASRGRLLAERNARLLPHDLLALWHERSVLGVSSPFLGLLGWAASWLAQRTRLAPTRSTLHGLARDLPEADEPPAVPRNWRLTAGSAVYAEPLSIAADLARARYGGARDTARSSSAPATGSLLLKTYEAYEALVSDAWRRVAAERGCTHRAQHVRVLASVVAGGGVGQVERDTRTDDSISLHGRGLIVSDSKYKLDPRRVASRENLYQLISTCLAHGVHQGLLVLPHGPAEPVALEVQSALLLRPLQVVVVRTPMSGRTPQELLAGVTGALDAALELLLLAAGAEARV